ncbi:MAG: acyl-CoA dehydrogenase family protein [Halobacteriaceae archaeon]
MVEYHESGRAAAVRDRARELMDDVVVPAEREHAGGTVPDGVVAELREAARDRDVYAPQVPERFGGLGLDFREALPVFEEAGRSLLGPPAMRVDAPDQGNIDTILLAGTEAQKERWVPPLVEGEMASGFSMTEPMQGAGSDPKMIRTTAEKGGDEWVLTGHKWWTTNGVEADLLLVMARTDEDRHPYAGCSIFLVPADADGVHVERNVPHLGPTLVPETHAEIVYDGVRVPEENLLGELNDGFALAQRRLGPARLTHCFRFTGMAQRSLDVASAYLAEREAFGSPLAEKTALRHRLADAATDLHAARTMVRHAAEKVADGEEARVEVSMSKVFAANVCNEAIDLAVQVCGGAGISRDLPLADFYEAVRAFRIVDGADEVHRRVVAREVLGDPDPAELSNLPRF